MLNTIIFPLNIVLCFPAKHVLVEKRIFLFGGNRKNQFCNNCELSVTSLIYHKHAASSQFIFQMPHQKPGNIQQNVRVRKQPSTTVLSRKHVEKSRYHKATQRTKHRLPQGDQGCRNGLGCLDPHLPTTVCSRAQEHVTQHQ